MKKIKTLTALISASLSPSVNANQDISVVDTSLNTFDINSVSHVSVLNKTVSHRLAAHRSHSSHRSHRSSSGGGYSSYTAPQPVYTPPATKKTTTHDPLGQQQRPSQSYPSNKKKIKGTKADVKNIVMQVQLALLLEGLYKGEIDGVMGPTTRQAINAFKKKNNITSKALLGTETLNALGVKGF